MMRFYEDSFEGDKILTVIQDIPLPTIIASLDIYMETSEE
jgi:hypothetical protein